MKKEDTHIHFNVATVFENLIENRDKFKKRKSSKGFAGYTHALSGLAISLLVLAFLPDVISFAGISTIFVAIAFVMSFTGATLVPDLDNTSSTSRNSLGFFGVLLSEIFRLSSQVIQTVVRLKRDDPTPNPHRGFYHTILSSFLLGGVVWFLTSINTPLSGGDLKWRNWGDVFAVFFLFILTHLTFSSLGKSYFKKIKKNFFAGEIASFIISFLVAIGMFFTLPSHGDYLWLATATTLGCIVHILGDGFTRYGVPLIFPIPFKGKMWWYFRFAKLESGGEMEKTVFPIIFGIMIAVAIAKISIDFFN